MKILFGYVQANWKELTVEQKQRYQAAYCGICRRIRAQSGALARLSLSYDMAFLSLLLMSLYEPEESSGKARCAVHPAHPRAWLDSEYIRYSADMNVALAYYNCLDDWNDDAKRSAKYMASALEKPFSQIASRYPRQCDAIERAITHLNALEKENCPNPDACANVFGELMAELFVVQEDIWSPTLRAMGMALGRFIYLIDAANDYDTDKRRGKYNPYLAMGMERDEARWEEYLVLAMSRCTENFEKLPLVQDKALLDNILYSGVWTLYRVKGKEGKK